MTRPDYPRIVLLSPCYPTVGPGMRIGGEAAELFHQVAMDGGQPRLAKPPTVIAVGGDEDLDEYMAAAYAVCATKLNKSRPYLYCACK